MRAVVVVTTDKCYENREWDLGLPRRPTPLGGHDPYSASKACAELVAAAYRPLVLLRRSTRHGGLATARAGNVIGGGDWAPDRIVPDIVRAPDRGRRRRSGAQPHRRSAPWQHVLEPLDGYLLLARALLQRAGPLPEAWNFGPGPGERAATVGRVIEHLRGPVAR